MGVTSLFLEALGDEQALSTLNDIDRDKIIYSKLLKNANDNFKRISSGSSRVVYLFKDKYVIKLAKNAKGIDQNKTEVTISSDKQFEDIVTQIFYHSENYSFLVSEKADKMRTVDFKSILGFTWKQFKDYVIYLQYIRLHGLLNKGYYHTNFVELRTKPFVKLFNKFLIKFKLMGVMGDFIRPSSYGEVHRNGKSLIVITDYGISEKYFNKYYD